MNRLWCADPILFVLPDDLESHRLRYMIREKAAPIEVKLITEPLPPELRAINPDNTIPFLTDKGLFVTTHSLDEFIHERFPAPPMLPGTPAERAKLRQLLGIIQGWYDEINKNPRNKRLAKRIIEQSIEPSLPVRGFMLSNEPTSVDIALAPLLYRAHTYGAHLGLNSLRYTTSLIKRPAFQEALTTEERRNHDPNYKEPLPVHGAQPAPTQVAYA